MKRAKALFFIICVIYNKEKDIEFYKFTRKKCIIT